MCKENDRELILDDILRLDQLTLETLLLDETLSRKERYLILGLVKEREYCDGWEEGYNTAFEDVGEREIQSIPEIRVTNFKYNI